MFSKYEGVKWLQYATCLRPHLRIQSSQSREAIPFAQGKWLQEAGGHKLEVAFVVNYHKTFSPSDLRTERGLSPQGTFKINLTVVSSVNYIGLYCLLYIYMCATFISLHADRSKSTYVSVHVGCF